MQDYSSLSPAELRTKFRTGELVLPTAGLCPGYIQGNLVILHRRYGEDFLQFMKQNPKPCPILEVFDQMCIRDSPLSMKASLEFSFLLSGLYSSAMHLFVYHNITLEAAPMLATSAASALLAGVLGLKVFRKIDKNKISLVAYILLPLMAVNLIITGLSV